MKDVDATDTLHRPVGSQKTDLDASGDEIATSSLPRGKNLESDDYGTARENDSRYISSPMAN